MKYIWTLINPEGTREIIIGAYEKESQARSVAKRKNPADWLLLCTYPNRRRPLREGEKVKFGDAYKD